MRLSAEMYEQIVAGLKSDSHRDKDKRREPRVGMAGEVDFVTVDDAGKRIAGSVKIRDVSRSGVGLLVNQRIAPQQRFVVQLASFNGEPIWLVCISAYCRPIDGGRFSVGARIMQLLRAEEIQKVEAKAMAANQAAIPIPRRASEGQEADIARISRAILG
jgi:hypothetical protein